MPLLLTPYFISVFGVEKFAVIALCQTIMLYLSIVVEYDFSVIAVKDISMNRDDLPWVRIMFSRIFFTRIFLAGLCFILLAIPCIFYPLLRQNYSVLLFSYPMLIGQMLLSNWFYQSMEELKLMSAINIFGKALYVLGVFIFIRNDSDFFLPNALLGISNIIAAIFGLVVLTRRYQLHYNLPMFNEVIWQLKTGRRVFLSNVSVSFYSNANTLLIGAFCSPVILGYYSVIERVLAVMKNILSVFFQITYPRVAHLTVHDRQAIIRMINNFYMPFLLLVSVACGLTWIFSDAIVFYFLHEHVGLAIMGIKMASVIPIIVFLNIPWFQLLLIHNHTKVYSNTLFSAGILLLAISSVSIPLWGIAGAVISLTITECAVTLTLYYFAKHKYNLL